MASLLLLYLRSYLRLSLFSSAILELYVVFYSSRWDLVLSNRQKASNIVKNQFCWSFIHCICCHLCVHNHRRCDKVFFTWLLKHGACFTMMTSSNGNIFRVTGPLCGEFTGPGEFPTQRPVTRSFDDFFDLRLNKPLSKQPWGWWFETLSRSLWRHRNANVNWPNQYRGYLSIYLVVYSLHHNVLPTLQSVPLMTNGPLYPITQDSSCHGQHTMPRNPWSYPMTSSA